MADDKLDDEMYFLLADACCVCRCQVDLDPDQRSSEQEEWLDNFNVQICPDCLYTPGAVAYANQELKKQQEQIAEMESWPQEPDA